MVNSHESVIGTIHNGIVNQIDEILGKNAKIVDLQDALRASQETTKKLESRIRSLKKKIVDLEKQSNTESNNNSPSAPVMSSELLSQFKGAGVIFDPAMEYLILSTMSGLAIGVKEDSDHAQICTMKKGECPEGTKWTFEYQGDGSYILRNALSSKVIELGNNSIRPGGKIWQSIDSGKDSQKIVILPMSNRASKDQPEEFVIFFKKSGLAWDLLAESSRPNTIVQQWTPTFRSSQRWFIQRIS